MNRRTEKTETPEALTAQCIAHRLRLMHRVVMGIYDEALRAEGVDMRVSQMNILVAAGKMGTARPAEVCKRLHLDVSTLSRNVERMKARGWLEVIPDDDGRAQPFRLTSEGHKRVEQAAPAWKKAQKQAKSLLGDGIVDLLGQAVGRLKSNARSR